MAIFRPATHRKPTILPKESAHFATVSLPFVTDWLASIRLRCSPERYDSFLSQTGFSKELFQQPNARVTHDQIVRLYQVVAIETGDEMMGLWSRPVRSGALKTLCKAVITATSIRTAIFEFTRFWNLLLDDFELRMSEDADRISIAVHKKLETASIHRFGHMLMLKLTHGIVSWLAGQEVAVIRVGFAFPRPPFAEDYPILFPSQIGFGEASSCICFPASVGSLPIRRRIPDMREFLIRAPRDWIFTSSYEHAIQLKVRELLHASDTASLTLTQAANALHMSARTLARRLEAENHSFQSIKDGLRRDLAIRDLMHTTKSLQSIGYDIGFSSPAVFHRAFRQWTGTTPASYRQHFTRAGLRSDDGF